MKKCQPPEADPCRNPGLNQGPLDLQSNALPTELFRLTRLDVSHVVQTSVPSLTKIESTSGRKGPLSEIV